MKRLIALILTTMILTVMSSAYTAEQKNAADALNHLGLFLGTGTAKGYDLDANLNRNQGVILLVRMLGKEDAAKSGEYQHTFVDVPAGASGYVGYAYSQRIVNGYTATKFGGADTMSDTMFLALTLRALGYSDSGETPDFQYQESRKMAKSLGLVADAEQDLNFTRGDAVEVFWKALHTSLKGQTATLADRLLEQGVVTKEELTKAADIRKNGLPDTSSGSSGSSGSNGSSGGSGSSGSNGSSGGSSSGGDSGGSSGSGTGTGSGGTTQKTYTWEEYMELSPEKQEAFFAGFTDPAGFFAWQQEAKAAYDAAHPSVEIGKDGTIDLGGLVKP